MEELNNTNTQVIDNVLLTKNLMLQQMLSLTYKVNLLNKM